MVKQSFVILTSGHSDAQGWASECPDVKNYKWRLNPVWHRIRYSCTHMATVGVKGLNKVVFIQYRIVTDRQTDRQTPCDSKDALSGAMHGIAW